jgi:hypothetical protein
MGEKCEGRKPHARIPSHHLAPARRLANGGKDSLRWSHRNPESVLNETCLGEQVLAVVGSQEFRPGVERPSQDWRVLEHDVHATCRASAAGGSTTCISSSATNVSKNGRSLGALAARLRRVSSITKAL